MDNYLPLLLAQNSEEAYTLSAEFYTKKSILDQEHKAIFENSWQLVGVTDNLKKKGDQMVIQIGRVPLVIVHTNNGEIKAFHNVCRHRAGPLATENCNNKFLRCKYHGWTYTLDGKLKSAPEMNCTPDFDITQIKLPEAKVELWNGFIFVNLNSKPVAFSETFQDIEDTIHPIQLNQFQYHHRDEYKIRCNWKVYMDNYLEGYHLPHIHPGLNKLLDYRSYSTTLSPWYSYQHSPIEGSDSFYGAGQAHYYCIYPNIMFNILPDRLQTNVITPIDEKTTLVTFDYYYQNIEQERMTKMIEEDQEFSDQVQIEDVDICEKVQIGLESGSYHTGRLCMKRETGVLHFQNLVRMALKNEIEK